MAASRRKAASEPRTLDNRARATRIRPRPGTRYLLRSDRFGPSASRRSWLTGPPGCCRTHEWEIDEPTTRESSRGSRSFPPTRSARTRRRRDRTRSRPVGRLLADTPLRPRTARAVLPRRSGATRSPATAMGIRATASSGATPPALSSTTRPGGLREMNRPAVLGRLMMRERFRGARRTLAQRGAKTILLSLWRPRLRRSPRPGPAPHQLLPHRRRVHVLGDRAGHRRAGGRPDPSRRSGLRHLARLCVTRRAT